MTNQSVGSGVIAGTVVWTDGRSIPIEQIRPGDRILLDGATDAASAMFQLALATVCHEKESVTAIMYADPSTPGRATVTFAADNHRFWVVGRGWVTAEALEEDAALLCHDGRTMFVQLASPVYATGMAGVGWFPMDESMDGLGHLVDLSKASWLLLESYVHQPISMPDDGSRLLIDVFNLKVDGAHPYHVGSAGITSCPM